MPATIEQIIAEIEALAEPVADLVLTSRLFPPIIGTECVVIGGDDIRAASDRSYEGVLIDVTFLAPINEGGESFDAEKRAAQSLAYSSFASLRAAIEGRYSPWRQAWVESRPRYHLVRPVTKTLCASASASFGFAL